MRIILRARDGSTLQLDFDDAPVAFRDAPRRDGIAEVRLDRAFVEHTTWRRIDGGFEIELTQLPEPKR